MAHPEVLGPGEEAMTTRSESLAVDGVEIAVRIDEGAAPPLFWMSGFRSDMAGSKAEALAAHGRERGRRVVRFDYSGHGVSGGRFEDGTIGRWAREAEAVHARHVSEPAVLVGSSMGGWIALLLALRLARGEANGPKPKGLVLIAPAPDFTHRLMEPAFTDAMRADLAEKGRTELPSAYGTPTPISRAFLNDGRRHAILDADLKLGAPVHILQGMEDADVPHTHARLLVDRLVHDDVTLTLVKDGDHRLSRPEDIARLLAAVDAMVAA